MSTSLTSIAPTRGPEGPTSRGGLRAVLGVALSAVLAVGAALAPTTAALAAPGAVAHGVVIADANANGAIDSAGVGEDDRGLEGVTVELLDAGGGVVASTVTDPAGNWAIAEADVDPQPAAYPYTVRITTSGANGNVYATYPTATPGVNDFARAGGPNRATATVTDPDTELNALVYPSWKLDAQLANDPDGVGGKSILTGTPVFDPDDSEDGWDSGTTNTRVRSADIVSYNWSLTAATEDGSLGTAFTDAVFEQTIVLNDGALANFPSIPAVCLAASGILAQPGNVALQARQDPPVGSTSVTLTCVLGEMGVAPAPSAILLGTQVQPSSTSPNGSSFETEVRFFGVDANGAATAQPSPGPEVPPIDITAAPRYDLEKINGDASGNYPGSHNGEPGLFSYYTVQISTERKVGVEAFTQPITMQESFWALIPPPVGDGSQMSDLRWYVTGCIPTPSPRSGQVEAGLVFGKIGGTAGTNTVATAANSVRDSGTCTIGARTGDPDRGSYELSMNGIDTSGLTYPTQTVGGSSLAAGPFYVASYRVQIFIPQSELDRTDGIVDGNGALSIYNRVGDFDPVSVTGASNFGTGVEPGYCDPGPVTDQSANCDLMPGSTEQNPIRSNNVVGPYTKRIQPGSWGKYIIDATTGWRGGYTYLPDETVSHGGAGQVQPGQAFTSFQVLHNTSPFDMPGVQMCDVFDGTMLKLAPLNEDASSVDPFADGLYSAVVKRVNHAGVSAADSQAAMSNWVTEYGVVDLSGDDPNLGVFDTANARWQGDWTAQRAATDGAGTVCGDPAMTWYASPDAVPGGIDAVNAVRLSAAPGYGFEANTSAYWYLAFEQRDTYNGGPHAGEMIPGGTIAANYGNVRTSGVYNPNWIPAAYVPGAGPTGGAANTMESSSVQGDRWTVSRALMRLQKRTIAETVNGEAASGVADFGATGSAVAGKPVVWEIVSALTAASLDPAPVNNVVVTDTLPNYVIYNEAGTQALATAGGFPMPASVTPNGDGTTTIVWNLGTRIPNQDLPVLRIATHTDSMAPPNTTAVNVARITATGVTPVPVHVDDHTITIQQTGQVQLKKSVDRALDLQDDDQKYLLELRNFSETLPIQAPTIYEVLPYNGDATNSANVQRTPPSDYAGASVLDAAPAATNWNGDPRPGTFWYTTVAPGDVPQQQSDDTDASIWESLADIDPDEATALGQVTGFKFVASTPLTTTANVANSGIRIAFQTNQDGNDPGDLYTNRFTAISQTLSDGNQLLTSNTVSVRVIGFSLGDFIWFDVNRNGTYDVGVDRPAPSGVTVEVRDADGALVTTATTLGGDQEGRWVVNDLPRGDYYVTIPASQFAAGGPLAGAIPAPNAVLDPNTDANEDGDHHAIADAGGVRSAGTITLDADTAADPIAGLEPAGDNVAGLILSPLTTDDFTNLTLDLALVPAVPFTVEKVVDGDGAEYGTGSFQMTVTCTYDGAAAADYPQVFALAGGASKELTAPLGSLCSVEETGTGSATTVVVDPADGLELDSEDGEFTFTVTNTFELGSLRLYKDVTGAGQGAGLTEGKVYTFDIVCAFNGTADAFTETVQITDTGLGQMYADVDGIPVGASCTITETDDGGADATPLAETRVIVDKDTVVIFCLENVFSAGTIELVKTLDGDAKDDEFLATLSYEVQLVCELVSGDIRGVVYSEALTLVAGEVVVPRLASGDPVALPLGTHCWIEEESVDQGAAGYTADFDSYENAAIVVAQEDPDVPQTLALTAVNTFDLAEFTVSKKVVGPGSGPFAFEVACMYLADVWVDGEGGDGDGGDGGEGDAAEPATGWVTQWVEYPLAPEDAKFTLNAGESRTITVLAGVDCLAVETPVPAGATLTVVDSDPTTWEGAADGWLSDIRGTENSIEFTNTYPPLQDTGSAQSLAGLGLASGLLALGAALLAGLLVARRRTREP